MQLNNNIVMRSTDMIDIISYLLMYLVYVILRLIHTCQCISYVLRVGHSLQ